MALYKPKTGMSEIQTSGKTGERTHRLNMMFLSRRKRFPFLTLSQEIQYDVWNNGLLKLAKESNKHMVRMTGTTASLCRAAERTSTGISVFHEVPQCVTESFTQQLLTLLPGGLLCVCVCVFN